MGKTNKKKKTKATPKASPSGNDGISPGLQDPSKNNPSFCVCLVLQGRPDLTSLMPYQDVPSNVFQCGLQDASLHWTIKEALTSILSGALSKVLISDDTVDKVIQNYIDTYYSETDTGNGYFQFSYAGATDTMLRYSFSAVTNFLSTAPIPENGKKHLVYAMAPECIAGMIQHLVTSAIYDKPEDEFFERARDFLPPTITNPYDTYLATPTKQREFERFSHALYHDPNGVWHSPYTVYTVLDGGTRVPADSPTNPPNVPPTSSGNENPPPAADSDGPNQVSQDTRDSDETPTQLPSGSNSDAQDGTVDPSVHSSNREPSSAISGMTPSENDNKSNDPPASEAAQATSGDNIPPTIPELIDPDEETLHDSAEVPPRPPPSPQGFAPDTSTQELAIPITDSFSMPYPPGQPKLRNKLCATCLQ